MSRAFVKEDDGAIEEVPDRPISPHKNLVTPEGLAAIDAEIARLTDAQSAARDKEDREALAHIGRDLRYWHARRGSAHLVEDHADDGAVRFGSRVTIERAGKREIFRIVGEDEADPERGTLSYISPLAQALMGKEEGDETRVAGADVEILKIA
ncbi:MAG: transcription elongation factor GreA [Hyphomonadaceae bacterium]